MVAGSGGKGPPVRSVPSFHRLCEYAGELLWQHRPPGASAGQRPSLLSYLPIFYTAGYDPGLPALTKIPGDPEDPYRYRRQYGRAAVVGMGDRRAGTVRYDCAHRYQRAAFFLGDRLEYGAADGDRGRPQFPGGTGGWGPGGHACGKGHGPAE